MQYKFKSPRNAVAPLESIHAKSTDPRNSLNELSNTEWMYFTRSAWVTAFPNDVGFALRKEQGGNKSPRMMKELINFFTKAGEKVLDPMSGVGGTLLGCALAGRDGVGIELNPKWTRIYNQVCAAEKLRRFQVISGDCVEVLRKMKPASFDFVVVDPPYREDTKWDRTMCNNTYVTRAAGVPERYSLNEKDFGNTKNYSGFLERILILSQEIGRVLKQRRYFVVFCKDEYQNGEFQEKSTSMAEKIREAGFQWKGKITWYQAGAKLRPYGIPYSFVPNITDQKILVFRRKD